MYAHFYQLLQLSCPDTAGWSSDFDLYIFWHAGLPWHFAGHSWRSLVKSLRTVRKYHCRDFCWGLVFLSSRQICLRLYGPANSSGYCSFFCRYCLIAVNFWQCNVLLVTDWLHIVETNDGGLWKQEITRCWLQVLAFMLVMLPYQASQNSFFIDVDQVCPFTVACSR